MKSHVHIFFNNDGFVYPDSPHDFYGYKEHDAARLALAAAQSWRSHGWTASFYHTRDTKGFKFGAGRFNPTVPDAIFNYWFEALKLAPAWFSTMDVFNYGFEPYDAYLLQLDMERQRKGMINPQEGTYCTGCFYATREYCQHAIDTLLAYDAGFFETTMQDGFYGDEQILRVTDVDRVLRPLGVMSFGYSQTGWEKYPLVHFTRTGLKWARAVEFGQEAENVPPRLYATPVL